MTVIDLLILGVVSYALVVFTKIRKRLTTPRTRYGFAGIVVGLSLVALFYLVDLLTMHVLSLFMPMAKATVLMQDLHLNHQWLVALLGVGSIALGLAAASRGTFALIENLEKSRTDLQEELWLRRKSEQARQEGDGKPSAGHVAGSVGRPGEPSGSPRGRGEEEQAERHQSQPLQMRVVGGEIADGAQVHRARPRARVAESHTHGQLSRISF